MVTKNPKERIKVHSARIQVAHDNLSKPFPILLKA